jgi:hypothetical protein
VSRALTQRGILVNHILDDGDLLSHAAVEDKLLERAGRGGDDLFAPREDRLAMAYREWGRKVAFTTPKSEGPAADA